MTKQTITLRPIRQLKNSSVEYSVSGLSQGGSSEDSTFVAEIGLESFSENSGITYSVARRSGSICQLDVTGQYATPLTSTKEISIELPLELQSEIQSSLPFVTFDATEKLLPGLAMLAESALLVVPKDTQMFYASFVYLVNSI